MAAHHGGGLFVVVETCDDATDDFVIYDLNGRLPAEKASFDRHKRVIHRHTARTTADRLPTEADGASAGLGAVPYRRYFGSISSASVVSFDVMQKLGAAFRFNGLFTENESATPAAYTYLGQFIFHDITSRNPHGLNIRSASLDLDSVLGRAAGGSHAPAEPMALGTTTPGNQPYDLPRQDGKALIVDQRSDDNLPLAQTHMAVIRFFNAIVANCPGIAQAEARALAVLHFQSVV